MLSTTERDRILQAMADCCAERGYEETSVDTVVERARVRREDFESYFTDKEDCALAALNLLVSETLAVISTARPADTEPERRAAQILAVVELMRSRVSFARLGYIDARQGGTPRMHETYESAARVLSLMMERAQSEDALPPASTARAALGGAEAVVRRELVAGRAERLQCHLPDFVYAALVPFVGQEEALRQSRVVAKLVAEEE